MTLTMPQPVMDGTYGFVRNSRACSAQRSRCGREAATPTRTARLASSAGDMPASCAICVTPSARSFFSRPRPMPRMRFRSSAGWFWRARRGRRVRSLPRSCAIALHLHVQRQRCDAVFPGVEARLELRSYASRSRAAGTRARECGRCGRRVRRAARPHRGRRFAAGAAAWALSSARQRPQALRCAPRARRARCAAGRGRARSRRSSPSASRSSAVSDCSRARSSAGSRSRSPRLRVHRRCARATSRSPPARRSVSCAWVVWWDSATRDLGAQLILVELVTERAGRASRAAGGDSAGASRRAPRGARPAARTPRRSAGGNAPSDEQTRREGADGEQQDGGIGQRRHGAASASTGRIPGA